ncbi:MAG: cyclic nucleotide-binding domain-containing protein [Proteobacteria bacterium]|nr:cyclic nucleotide-binding domain-containing protein [Pseudomonadota bacterium]
MSQTPVEVLQSLSPAHRAEVRSHVSRAQVERGAVLIEEGETDQSLLWVEAGRLRIDRESVLIDHSGPGEVLGEMALFSDGKRSATVRVEEDATVLVLDGAGFQALIDAGNPFAYWVERQALGMLAGRLRRLNAKVADLSKGEPSPWFKPPPSVFARIGALFSASDDTPKRVPRLYDVPNLLYTGSLFSGATWAFLVQVADMLQLRPYEAGDFLCEQGSTGDELYVVASGSVDVLVATAEGAKVHVHKLAQVGPGAAIGLSALADGSPRSASCVVTEPTDVLVLSGERWRTLRDADHRLGSEVRRAVIRGFASALGEAAGHLVSLEHQRSGRPEVPTLPTPQWTGMPAPERVEIATIDEEIEGPAQIFIDPNVGVVAEPAGWDVPELEFGVDLLLASASSEVSLNED